MGAPRFRKSPDERLFGRVQKDELCARHPLPDPTIGPGELRCKSGISDVEHDADLLFRSLAGEQLVEKRVEKGQGQIVDAKEPDVLETTLDVAFPRSGKAGDDDEAFRSAAQAFPRLSEVRAFFAISSSTRSVNSRAAS